MFGALGASFYILALSTHSRNGDTRRNLLVHGFCALLAGLAYFCWRTVYFHQLLPLPLYVKSRGGDKYPGVIENVHWFASGNGPWPLIAVALLFIALLATRQLRWSRHILGTVPGWFLLVAMATAFQSQNVDWRFQAPTYTLLTCAMIGLGALLWRSASTKQLRFVAFVACMSAFIPALCAGKKIWPVDYMDSFAVRLGSVLRNERLAVTEAGRIAYWSHARVYDLVGLNLAYTARHPPSAAYVASLAPDLIMFHIAGAVDASRMPIVPGPPDGAPVIRIDGTKLSSMVIEPFRKYLLFPSDEYGPFDMSTKVAPVAIFQFLATRTDYDVFAVRYDGSYSHIYAVKRDRPATGQIEDLILHAFDASYITYAAAKKNFGGFAIAIASVAPTW